MRLLATPTGMFSIALLLSLVFTAASPTDALGLPSGHNASGSLSNGSIDYAQQTTILASIMSQQRGSPGSRVTITGSGFPPFTPVESIEIDGIPILSHSVTTDQNGSFEANDLLVPGLDPGIYTLVIRVNSGSREITSASTFEVTPANEAAGASTAVAQALAPLGDHLERAFHFDNATKVWSFYDPRPAFFDANTMRELTEGQVYWIKVAQSVRALLNGNERALTCINEGTAQEDCWNLVVW